MKNLLTGPTRCLIVRAKFLENTFYSFSSVYRMLGVRSAAPPLGALIVAALLPHHWDLRFIDEDVEPVTDADIEWADIVMVSGLGSQLDTIMAIVDRAHAHHKLVAIGGAGATIQPDMFIGKVDFVVIGEAETALPQLLEDLGKGVRSGVYRAAGSADLEAAVTPRYDLAKLDKYLFVGVNYIRGCPFSCEFCAQIEIFGRKPRAKTTAQVLKELQMIYDLGYRGQIDFGYDNLIGDIERAEDVLTAMKDWSRARGYPFFYSTEATMNLARLPKLMELMRDNDFRTVFVGIESAEFDVLDRAKKGQNTSMPASEAVRIFNSYGFVITTGLIIGFDGETERSAENMLRMVSETGAFPTLVLPLHALPNTQLAARLRREGRIFEGGVKITRKDRTDTATTGLNFVTSRPRTAVLRDLAHVLEELYNPKNQYERIARTRRQLRPAHKHIPPVRKMAQLGYSFVQIAASIGLEPTTRSYFWEAFATTMLTKPFAIEQVVSQAVLHNSYARQAQSYIRALREEAEEVERVGEAQFNADRLESAPTAAA